MLNEYLKTHKNTPCEAANVPNDGSCLYHAILHSFEAKYSHQIEINHQKMRENVAIHMLRGQENTEYLRNFAMAVVQKKQSKKDTLNMPKITCIIRLIGP